MYVIREIGQTMKNLNQLVAVYKAELEKGDILVAYNALVKFVMKVRADFSKQSPSQYSLANILHGYMDYTYFYYSNDYVKSKKLKFSLVLNHLEMRFEIWLLGNTIPIQKKYWDLLKESKWNKNRSEKPQYSILEAVIVDEPDFNDLEKLSEEILTKLNLVTDEIIGRLESESV